MKKDNKYAVVLIDLDDTLIEEEGLAHKAFLAAAEYLKERHDIVPHEFVATVRTAARTLWHSLSVHDYAKKIGISSWEALWAEFSSFNEDQRVLQSIASYYRHTAWENALLSYDINDSLLAAQLADIFKTTRAKLHHVYQDSYVFLDYVHTLDIKKVLITNGTPDLQRYKIQQSGLEPYFDSIVISGEFGIRKPHAEIFLHAVEEVHGDPESTIMIGNSIESDIAGAGAAGIFSVWINRPGEKSDDTPAPDAEVRSLEECIPLLR